MKEILATLTQRSQVTIPAEVRRLLGLKPHGKVVFAIEDATVKLVPARFTLESAYQSVPPLEHPLDEEEMVRIAKEERAEAFVRKQRGR